MEHVVIRPISDLKTKLSEISKTPHKNEENTFNVK